MRVSDKSKIIYLIIIIVFLTTAGFFWLDYLGLININQYTQQYLSREEQSVLYAGNDEPSLVKLEEFEKEKARLQELTAELDRREARLLEMQKDIEREQEKIEEQRQGLELEKKKFDEEKEQYSGYKQNVADLATKIENMPPADSVAIMVNWEDPLIIDVLRQMDQNAEAAGNVSITSFLISQMPKDKASRIMYLMTQL
jgi:flagellar protein FlbB